MPGISQGQTTQRERQKYPSLEPTDMRVKGGN